MARVFTLFFILLFGLTASNKALSYSRVIATSPSLTELIYQIEGQDRLVATVDYSDYPTQAKSKPSIGSFYSPSIEKTTLLKPDLVLIDGAARNHHYELALNRLGIPIEVITINSIKSLYQAAERLRKIFEIDAQDTPLSSEFPKKPYTFIGFVWANPSIVLAQNTFLNSILEWTSGLNLSKFNFQQAYVTVSKEWLMLQKPEVVFFLQEFDYEKQAFEKFCKDIWNKQTPRIIYLSSNQFARTSFTPLAAMNDKLKEIHVLK